MQMHSARLDRKLTLVPEPIALPRLAVVLEQVMHHFAAHLTQAVAKLVLSPAAIHPYQDNGCLALVAALRARHAAITFFHRTALLS